MILYILGLVIGFEGVFMALPCITALLYGEAEGVAFLIVMLICLLIGILSILLRPKKNTNIFAREGFVIVSLSWFMMSLFGALPYTINGDIPHFVDALFEMVSGFTTTGSSILSDVEALSHASMIWRSFSHWIGGMGVFVFMMAVLPLIGGQNIHLMRAESPGPTVGKLVPKVKNTAMLLYGIYFVMTVVQILLLLVGGVNLFDSLCLSFGTAGTGGFAILNSGMATYSPYVQYVITIFMILFGVNFNVYFFLLIRKFKDAFRHEEMRWYLTIIASAVLLITINLRNLYPTLEEAFRHAFFQVGSIITTTGYATTDFNYWPVPSQAILVLLMFIGACAGSTGGGFKVSRVILLVKSIFKEMECFVHPRSVRKIKMDGRQVEGDTVRSVSVYLVVYLCLFIGSFFVICLDEFDLVTNFTATASALNNIGPGLQVVGPMGNYGAFSDVSKIVLIFDMLAGRLELFPVLLLFYPGTWKYTGITSGIRHALHRKQGE